MNFLPIFLDLRGRTCLVAGGGETAARKSAMLLNAGAWLRVVHEGDLAAAFSDLKEYDRITHLRAAFAPAMLEGVDLVIGAAEDDVIDRQVYEAARARQLPVNVVDKPALCSFVLPAILDRSPMIVAIGTGGASPVLERLLRARLETLIPASYGRLAHLAESFRERVKAKFSHPPMRRIFWEKVLQGPVAEMVFAGKEEDAAKLLQHTLDNESDLAPLGEVYLVGAGPGHEGHPGPAGRHPRCSQAAPRSVAGDHGRRQDRCQGRAGLRHRLGPLRAAGQGAGGGVGALLRRPPRPHD